MHKAGHTSYGTFSFSREEPSINVNLVIEEYLVGIISQAYVVAMNMEAKPADFSIDMSCIGAIKTFCTELDKKALLARLMEVFPSEKMQQAIQSKIGSTYKDKISATKESIRDIAVIIINDMLETYKNSRSLQGKFKQYFEMKR